MGEYNSNSCKPAASIFKEVDPCNVTTYHTIWYYISRAAQPIKEFPAFCQHTRIPIFVQLAVTYIWNYFNPTLLWVHVQKKGGATKTGVLLQTLRCHYHITLHLFTLGKCVISSNTKKILNSNKVFHYVLTYIAIMCLIPCGAETVPCLWCIPW